MTTTASNPCGIHGIDLIEFAGPDPAALHRLFLAFGFSRTMRHRDKALDLYEQNEIRFLLNREPRSFGASFAGLHGPCIASMAWRTDDGAKAFREAVKRGATPSNKSDLGYVASGRVPSVFGIGESLLYFLDEDDDYHALGFEPHPSPTLVPSKGFLAIDHLTNNVHKGTMAKWASFYKDIFGFTEVRYFDIRGTHTGLTSYALRSPCGTFSIPINEADEARSQINEYLEEYRGPGIQHLAFLTANILESLRRLEGEPIEMLDIEPGYYDAVFDRVPNVREDHDEIRRRSVLVDGDEKGYLLQIFTKNVVGPIFIEIIQRENHHSFGEGNFGALFRSIERDQVRRGLFD